MGKSTLISEFLLDSELRGTNSELIQIESEIHAAVSLVRKDFPNLHPKIYVFPMSAQNEHARKNTFGVSASAGTRRVIFSIALEEWTKGQVHTTLVHELNHVARLQHFSFFETGTLLDWMVFEGLTELYQAERLDRHAPSPWCNTTTKKELQDWFPLVRSQLHQANSESTEAKTWIFGRETLGATDTVIPPWFGYALGYDIVQKFRSAHPQLSWSELIQTPSNRLFQAYHPHDAQPLNSVKIL